jgi:hypothetical protein
VTTPKRKPKRKADRPEALRNFTPLAERRTREELFLGIVGAIAIACDLMLEEALRSTGARRQRTVRTLVMGVRNLAEISGARVAKEGSIPVGAAVSDQGGDQEAQAEWSKLPRLVQARLPPDFATRPKAERDAICADVARDITRERAKLERAAHALEQAEDPTNEE